MFLVKNLELQTRLKNLYVIKFKKQNLLTVLLIQTYALIIKPTFVSNKNVQTIKNIFRKTCSMFLKKSMA